MEKLLWIGLRAPEYSISDFIAWFSGANRGSGLMWKPLLSYNTIQQVPQLLVPAYYFNGRKDYNTPLELLEKYFKVLDAPKGKKLVIFEESAHTPFLGEPNKFHQELVRVKDLSYCLNRSKTHNCGNPLTVQQLWK